jgi:molybdopterin-guanine dinucleotide biosynthesis protein A
MARIAAVILAGGRGERLGGVNKANIRVGGVTLLDRVAARLAAADHLLIAHGNLDPASLSLAPGQIPLPDLPANYAGPLAGVAAAAAWCLAQRNAPEILVCAAVDAPFLPEAYLPRLVEALDTAPAAICRHAGQDYPTNSAWRLSALATLTADLVAGTAPHSLKRLGAALGAAFLDWPESDGGDPFANANTPEDLLALQRRAASSASS